MLTSIWFERGLNILAILNDQLKGNWCRRAGETGTRLRTIAHGLRGAGGSYGFDAVTLTAGELEEAYLAQQSPAALREAAILLAQAVESARRMMETAGGQH